ncbi:hypothetical protein [Xylocopilactobacillus apicola]|uniref:DUF2892 domain-containing protein n=1 Tax=Xylocopilactobacillus apicola TaxID=2932184 RepID=A0AAU9DAM1_9LACO|nr:hypothetical protein [Xylocopilactobacillus apicola]BDR59501.1 hypothetical protein XA3_19420 [Xylocopilactobacillus apicola]
MIIITGKTVAKFWGIVCAAIGIIGLILTRELSFVSILIPSCWLCILSNTLDDSKEKADAMRKIARRQDDR